MAAPDWRRCTPPQGCRAAGEGVGWTRTRSRNAWHGLPGGGITGAGRGWSRPRDGDKRSK